MQDTPILKIIGADALQRFSQADLAVVPFGSIEYHGPHAPLGTDSLIAQELGARVAGRLNAILCPLIAYTTCPPTTRNNPGTLSIDADVMTAYIENIFRGLFKHGVKGILAMNAHDGNIDTVHRASNRLFYEFPDCFILAINWWETLPTPLIESLGLFSKGGGHGHGGPLETSAAWAVAPQAVDLSRAADIDPRENELPMMSIHKDGGRLPKWPGYGGLISESSTEKGQVLLRLAEDRIVEMIGEWLKKGSTQ